jgi:hypothetical protein
MNIRASNADFGLMLVPTFIFLVIGASAISITVAKFVKVIYHSAVLASSKTGGHVNYKEFLKKIYVMRFPVITSFLVLFCWMSYIFLKLSSNETQIRNSLSTWTQCVFKNYDGSNQPWIELCGAVPAIRPNYNCACWLALSSGGMGALMSLLYLPHFIPGLFKWFHLPKILNFSLSSLLGLKHLKTSDDQFDDLDQDSGNPVVPKRVISSYADRGYEFTPSQIEDNKLRNKGVYVEDKIASNKVVPVNNN